MGQEKEEEVQEGDLLMNKLIIAFCCGLISGSLILLTIALY